MGKTKKGKTKVTKGKVSDKVKDEVFDVNDLGPELFDETKPPKDVDYNSVEWLKEMQFHAGRNVYYPTFIDCYFQLLEDQLWKCSLCCRLAKSPKDAFQHYMNHHEGSKATEDGIIKCPICQKSDQGKSKKRKVETKIKLWNYLDFPDHVFEHLYILENKFGSQSDETDKGTKSSK